MYFSQRWRMKRFLFRGKRWDMLPSLVAGLLLAVLVVGCGSSGVPLAKARGTVTFQGKPVVGAAVAFIPDNPGVVAALATTDANGVYDLATYDKKDGAPVGWCQVAISLRGPSPPLRAGCGGAREVFHGWRADRSAER